MIPRVVTAGPSLHRSVSRFHRYPLLSFAALVFATRVKGFVAIADNNPGRSIHQLRSMDRRLESPSAERNKEPIWEVLCSGIVSGLRHPTKQTPWEVLEIAAGTGVHTEHFASRLLRELESDTSRDDVGSLLLWHPTDPTEEARASIRSRIRDNPDLSRAVALPTELTLGESGIANHQQGNDGIALEEDARLDLMVCINMIHISPWEATLGLMRVASKHLREAGEEGDAGPTPMGSGGGYLYCYGPYRQDGKIVPSNEDFDRSLKSRNPEWGVRNLKDVVDAASKEGLELVECIDMPSNNTSLIFRRRRA